MRCLVLGARPYDFKDDDGARVSGATVHYLVDTPGTDAEAVGFLPMNLPASPVVCDEIRAAGAPAFYEMEFGQRPGRGGRPQTTLSGVKFIEAVSFGGSTDHLGD